MSILVKHLAFVKGQADFHEKMVEKYGAASFRSKLHKTTSDQFRALLHDMEDADKTLDAPIAAPKPPLGNKPPAQLSLTMGDIEGLPEELIKELNLSDADKTEFTIVDAIDLAGGVISLDKLLISLYKLTGEINKRAAISSRLARMAQKNMIFYVPGKKGVYSTEQISAEEAVRLFGAAKQEADAD